MLLFPENSKLFTTYYTPTGPSQWIEATFYTFNGKVVDIIMGAWILSVANDKGMRH
jgi:hypothetical protein